MQWWKAAGYLAMVSSTFRPLTVCYNRKRSAQARELLSNNSLFAGE